MKIIIELDCSLNSWEVDTFIENLNAEPYILKVTKDCSECKRPTAYCALAPAKKPETKIKP